MTNIIFLNYNELLFCFFISFIILLLVKLILFLRKINREVILPLKIFSIILNDFYLIFSKPNIKFGDNIYEREMIIQITTKKNVIYEGKLLGANGSGIICIVNNENIILNNFKNIKNIILIK